MTDVEKLISDGHSALGDLDILKSIQAHLGKRIAQALTVRDRFELRRLRRLIIETVSMEDQVRARLNDVTTRIDEYHGGR